MAITKVSSGLISADASSIDLNIDAGTLYLDVSENKVGIGTSSPSQVLHLGGASNKTVQVTSSTSNAGYFGVYQDTVGLTVNRDHSDGTFADTGKTEAAIVLQSQNANSFITFRTTPTNNTESTERMRIDKSGNVGIGTSSPSSYPIAPNLVVDAGTSGGVTIKSGTSNYGGIFFADGTTGNEQYRGFVQYNHNYAGSTDELILGTAGSERMRIDSTGIDVTGSIEADDYRAVGTGIFYATANTFIKRHSTGSEHFRIDSSGNVGIGTSSPSMELDVRNDGSGGVAEIGVRGGTSGAGVVQISGNGTTYGSTSFDLIQNSSAAYVFQRANLPLILGTNATERMRIDSSGNVGIGGSPTAKLDVSGDGTWIRHSGYGQLLDMGNWTSGLVRIESTGAPMYIRASGSNYIALDTNSVERMRIDSSGKVQIGTTSALSSSTFSIKGVATASQQVVSLHNPATSGTVYFMAFGTETSYAERGYITYDQSNVAFTQASDITLKENVRDLNNGLDTICKIKPRVFDWKDGHAKDTVGFIAQEVEEVKPDWVKEKDGIKMLDTNLPNTIPYLIKAIQEQQTQIEALQSEINLLKGE